DAGADAGVDAGVDVIVPTDVIPAACVAAQDCGGGQLCKAGFCTACVDDTSCAASAPAGYGPGHVCVAGACVPGDCHPASGCGSGEVCCNDAAQGGNFCASGTCCADSSCQNGLVCVGHACVCPAVTD